MGRRWIGTIVFAAAGIASLAAAQETDFRPVSNPFQEGYSYRIGEDLVPAVDLEGLRWTLVRVAAKSDREISAGQDVQVNVDIEFENRGENAVKVLVVLLLEDQQGNPLERLQIEPFRAGAGRFKAVRQKLKVPGDALLATEGLYLFCEIQE
jgi:hypothetical protein